MIITFISTMVKSTGLEITCVIGFGHIYQRLQTAAQILSTLVTSVLVLVY